MAIDDSERSGMNSDATSQPAVDNSAEPSLREQTAQLAHTLKALMDEDSTATPSDLAVRVFTQWLALAAPASTHPDRFTDVALNYPIQENTIRDLFDLFIFLEECIINEEETAPEQLGTFIGLPVIGSG